MNLIFELVFFILLTSSYTIDSPLIFFDNAFAVNNNTIPSDWFMMDASTMFNLEPGLEIHAIGNYVFDKPVNADNYKELVPSVRH